MRNPDRHRRAADGTTIGYLAMGDGPDVVGVGGAMRSAVDYLPLAQVLATRLRVHIVDRRGRGLSGPLGPNYDLHREREDLPAVQSATGACSVFGHSYGGLAVLQTAAHADLFDRVAVYEPGVSIGGSIPTAWLSRYQRFLDRGQTRAAFAHFIRHSGHAPGPVAYLPLWYLRAILRLVVRKQQWARFEPLLPANLREHQQVAALDGDIGTYGQINAEVLLLGGGKSPSFSARQPLHTLGRIIPRSHIMILDGLDHNAPDEKAPAAVAVQLLTFFADKV